MEVDANKFEVTSYRFNWDTDIDFPQPDKLISPEEAEEAFLTKGGLHVSSIFGPVLRTTRNGP